MFLGQKNPQLRLRIVSRFGSMSISDSYLMRMPIRACRVCSSSPPKIPIACIFGLSSAKSSFLFSFSRVKFPYLAFPVRFYRPLVGLCRVLAAPDKSPSISTFPVRVSLRIAGNCRVLILVHSRWLVAYLHWLEGRKRAISADFAGHLCLCFSWNLSISSCIIYNRLIWRTSEMETMFRSAPPTFHTDTVRKCQLSRVFLRWWEILRWVKR